jgi:Rhodanese-like domain
MVAQQGIDRNRCGGNVHQEEIAMISRLLVSFVFVLISGAASATVPTISIDELRQLLGKPEIVILDVRHPRDWQASNKKILGAIRIIDGDFTPIKAADRDKRFVLYCA